MSTLYWCTPGNEASNELPLRTGAHQGNLGTTLALGMYSVLVLTRGARDEASLELALRTGAYQESLGTRLAMSLQSVLVHNRGAWNKSSPGITLRTGAHQGSLGTRLALGLYTLHWCSPGEPGMRLAQGLYSELVLTVLIRRTSNSFCRPFNVSSSSSV